MQFYLLKKNINPNSNIESDVYMACNKEFEQIVKKKFEYFASLNDFNKLAAHPG